MAKRATFIGAAVTLHAEQLHQNRVWGCVEHLLDLCARQGIQITFLINPFRATIAGADLQGHLRHIRDAGHEVGQHTHFYIGEEVEPGRKRDDFGLENVWSCLRRDQNLLKDLDVSPKGFCGGAWVLNEAVIQGLSALGFLYDCTARTPSLAKRQGFALEDRRVAEHPEFLASGGDVLELPTTTSLGNWTIHRWGRHAAHLSAREETYELLYLHDEDLLRPIRWLVLQSYLRLRKPWLVTAEELQSRVRSLIPCDPLGEDFRHGTHVQKTR